MTDRAARFAAAAEALLGTPFRFRGHDPATGLDCVGVVRAALEASGNPVPVPGAYTMRQVEMRDWLPALIAAGLHETRGACLPGDVLLTHPGPAQAHLLVVGETGGLIHAHAGLGRTVRTPFPCPWPIARHWRLAGN